MGILTAVRSVFARLAGEPRYPQRQRVAYSGSTLAGIRVTPDTVVTVAAAWACLRYLSQTVAVLPWHVMRQARNGGEIASSHPVDWLLWKRPNPEWSAFQFRETLTHWALRWGNGYAEIERDLIGRPLALWPIHPERVLVLRDGDGRLVYRVYNLFTVGINGVSTVTGADQAGGYADIAAADMFHVRGFGEGPVGVNVVAYAAESIGWAKAAQLFGAAFFGNGMTNSVVVKSKQSLDEPGFKRLRARLKTLYGGIRKAHEPLILDNEMDVAQVSIDPEKGQFLETNQHLVEETCRWFGVPPHKVAHLLRATFCLPADAKVFTTAGPKRIAEIVAGDMVWSRDAQGSWVCSRVERSAPTGIDKILRISTTNRTVRMNARHRVLARRAHEVPRTSGKGGRNVNGRKMGVEWRTEYVPAGNLRVGDTVVTLESLPDLGETHAPNGRRLTPGFMAFGGLLLGDGNVFAGFVSIARATTAAYMEYYREVISAEFDAAANRGGYAGRAGERRPVLLQEAERQTRFSSVSAARELTSLGFSGTARTKRIPGWVFGLAEDLRLAFLAGFLDADGSVDKKGRMSFHSVSSDLLDDVRHLCIGLGIPVTNARRAKVKTTLPNGETFEGEISTFTCSDPGANRRVPTATPIYRERFEAGQPFGRKGRAYPSFGGAGFAAEGCGLARIVSIAEERAEPVYDLCVTGTHNFVADGVVVHNSNIEEQNIEVVVDSITPWCKRFEEEADYKLFWQNRPGFYTKMNMNALMRGNSQARADYYQKMVSIGAYSPNMVLALEDMPGIGEAGDKHVMQSQWTTLDMIGKAPATAPSPPSPASPANSLGIEERAAQIAITRLAAELETAA